MIKVNNFCPGVDGGLGEGTVNINALLYLQPIFHVSLLRYKLIVINRYRLLTGDTVDLSYVSTNNLFGL